MSKIEEHKILYYGGVKVGMETVLQSLEELVKIDEKLLTKEAVRFIVKDLVFGIESKLKDVKVDNVELGDEVIEVLNKLLD